MQKVKIITERLASISYRFAEKHNIALFPVNIMHKGKTYTDDDDAKAKDFLQKLETVEEIPTTGTPPLGHMIKAFEKATDKIKDAIYISPSSKLSSIHDHGVNVAKKLAEKGRNIKVFDSLTTVSMQGMMAYEAAKMAEEGEDIDTVYSHLKNLRDNRLIVEYGTLESLKFLKKSGRIGKGKSFFASLFSLKPVISAQNGELQPIGRVRTNEQGLDTVIKKIKEDMKRTGAEKLSVMYDYGLNEAYIRETVDPRMQKEFDTKIISFNQISIAIASHLGPNVWGVCAKFDKTDEVR